jgi:hypothetical protein
MTTNPRDPDAIAALLHRVEEFHDWIGSNVLFPVVPDAERDALVLSLGRIKRALVGALYDLDALDKVKPLPANVTPLKKR